MILSIPGGAYTETDTREAWNNGPSLVSIVKGTNTTLPKFLVSDQGKSALLSIMTTIHQCNDKQTSKSW